MNLFEEAQKFMATRQKPIETEQSFLSTNESKESFIRQLSPGASSRVFWKVVRTLAALPSLP